MMKAQWLKHINDQSSDLLKKVRPEIDEYPDLEC